MDSPPEIPDEVYRKVFDQMREELTYGLCLEVYRRERREIFQHLLSDKVNEEGPENSVVFEKSKSKGKEEVICPVCRGKKGAKKFASHLAKCMGVASTSRSKSRNITYAEDEDDEDEMSDECFKKPAKKHAGKSSRKRHDPSDPASTFLEVPLDKRKNFFLRKCGVQAKKSKKLCLNGVNCKFHSDKEREDVRSFFLIDDDSPLDDEDAAVEVDAVDDEDAWDMSDSDSGSVYSNSSLKNNGNGLNNKILPK